MVRYLYYKQPLYLEKAGKKFSRVRLEGESCFVKSSRIAAVHSTQFACVASPAPIKVAPSTSLADLPTDPSQGVQAGNFFPTFYQVALEALYPGKTGEKKVTLQDNNGKSVAGVSTEFRRALLRQGTAALSDGRVLNVGKKTKTGRRFIVLPEGSYGLGIAGFHLYPYRSVAVDFDLLCHRLKGAAGCEPDNTTKKDTNISRKNRKTLAGILLHIEKFAGVHMSDGTVHDGYVCAVDVGGGIKSDRMDIFVGTDGAGNPYYPACRRDNPLIQAGIESLIPSDWHHYTQNKNGKMKRTCQTEYRQVAAHKGLAVTAFPGIRCRKR